MIVLAGMTFISIIIIIIKVFEIYCEVLLELSMPFFSMFFGNVQIQIVFQLLFDSPYLLLDLFQLSFVLLFSFVFLLLSQSLLLLDVSRWVIILFFLKFSRLLFLF